MAGKTMTAAFLCAAVAAATAAGDGELMIERKEVRPIRAEFINQYEDDEIVRVHIVFDKEEVEETSLDEMIEKLERELPEGVLDVHSKKLEGYDITANVVYGSIEEIRNAAGVESVKLQERYGLFEEPQQKTDNQDTPPEEPDMEESNKEEPVGPEEVEEPEAEKSNTGAYAMLAAGGAATAAGILYWKRKDKNKK